MDKDNRIEVKITKDPAVSLEQQIEAVLKSLPVKHCCWHKEEKLELSFSATVSQASESIKDRPGFSGDLSIRPIYYECPACTLGRIGVSPKLVSCSFGNFQPDPPDLEAHLKACKDYASRPKGILILIGSVGTGKSHLSVAILRERVRTFVPYYDGHGKYTLAPDLLFISHIELLRIHRDTYSKIPKTSGDDSDDTIPPMVKCQETKLLVLDDLRSLVKDDDQRLVYEVLNHRTENFKPTIITTNIRPADLESSLGSALVDRIREAQFACLEFGSPSKRSALNKSYLDRCR